jgi:hypothetical protein
MDHAESGQDKTGAMRSVNAMVEPMPVEESWLGLLEKEDIVILFLSAVLIVATVWLAARIL